LFYEAFIYIYIYICPVPRQKKPENILGKCDLKRKKLPNVKRGEFGKKLPNVKGGEFGKKL
tara:strand:+ start:622 stop:804 length:183 start_codon:yes stop_codon:yes gene_type:complete